MVILEPENGTSYTKMIGVYDKWFLNQEEFNEFVKYYLQMTPKESLKQDNIVRTNHTTIETFEDNVRLAITGESKGFTSPYAKRRIKEIRRHPSKRG